MSLRLPQGLGTDPTLDRAMGAFHQEVLAEKAASLGRAAKTLSHKMSLLRDAAPSADRDALLQAAADTAYHYFIQRELCGLFSHQSIIDDYEIPREVLVRMGRN